ncbi:MAG: TAT-variant-translocated molybdopterin oxidoreductase [Phycisphaeraceae bacterium]|nr:TAT-variant-translocated molybdopterin oxidoreductase [Phycisphaeraceae bacterium]
MGEQSLSEQLRGRSYWRSLEQLADSPELAASMEREFPGYEPGDLLSMSRRGFMKIMAASMALAGLTLSGCRRWPQSQVRPFAYRPEGTLPGVPNYYATMMELGGVATGLLAKSYDGRPIKIEGNNLHPYSLGAADGFAQASVLNLYDPDRSRAVLEKQQGGKNQLRDWDAFLRYVDAHFPTLRSAGGKGLAVLTQAASGPTFQRLRQAFLNTFPAATWHVWEPINLDNAVAGSTLAFGQQLRTHYDLSKAHAIACFDADPLGSHPAHQRHARDWATLRRSADQGKMSRLYAVEANLTITGGVADHRLAVRPSRVAAILAAVAAELGVIEHGPTLTSDQQLFARTLAEDLKAHAKASAVIVGPAQPAEVHALAHAVNQALGNIGTTVNFTAEPLAVEGGHAGSIKALADAIGGGGVSTLVILGGNPAYDAPVDLNFAELLAKVEHTIHLSDYYNETSLLCRWHLPEAHYLEAWGDGRAWDGAVSTQQPLILPLFGGKSAIELLAILAGNANPQGLDLVRETFRGLVQGDFETAWRLTLEMGVLPTSALPAVPVDKARPVQLPPANEPVPPDGPMEAVFVADASMYDGRFANNGWLQEMPDPLSKLTWDNAALIAKADADRLGLPTSGGMVRLEVAGRSLDIATFILPGVAPGSMVLPLGYGRSAAGNVGDKVGFNTYTLRTLPALSTATVKVTKIDGAYKLAATQEHHLIDPVGTWGRDERLGKPGRSGHVIREASFAEDQHDKQIFHRDEHGSVKVQLWESPSKFNDPHAWGMAIDLTSCLGCNACAVACQAENNVPVVGKEQVANNREMHWLRVDRYFKGAADDVSPEVVHMPMFCLHCENAPCESVCPVAATVHDAEGLNTMVYNRCIGTRYCSNNCPYKVRHFNYFDFHASDPRGTPQPYLDIPDTQQRTAIDQIRQMVYNPDVTVRMRGVMEKCTYCVQRISAAKIHAKVDFADGKRQSELVQDGEVVTACQSACPTEAIVFGNLNDPHSRVSRLHANGRAYGMLDEPLNTRPRTKHLAIVRNPATPAGAAADGGHA